jgi:2,4-dienoyl-CoA reductase-like NADH-dependent reductase (Old Yellow Enzyme family)
MPTAVTSSPFAALKDTALFTPLKLGKIGLEHRIVQVSFT